MKLHGKLLDSGREIMPQIYYKTTQCIRLVNLVVVGEKNSDFIEKDRRLKRWWTSALKNYLLRVRIQVSFILKRVSGCSWLLQTSSCQNLLFLQLSTQVKSRCSCKTSNKTNVILCSTTFYWIWMEKGYNLKIRGLRMNWDVLSLLVVYDSGLHGMQQAC